MTGDLMSFLTEVQSCLDDGEMLMESNVQWKSDHGWRDVPLEQVLNSRPVAQHASAKPTALPGLSRPRIVMNNMIICPDCS